eukprot:361952-Chlamydomonas_euryale.AAC.1
MVRNMTPAQLEVGAPADGGAEDAPLWTRQRLRTWSPVLNSMLLRQQMMGTLMMTEQMCSS